MKTSRYFCCRHRPVIDCLVFLAYVYRLPTRFYRLWSFQYRWQPHNRRWGVQNGPKMTDYLTGPAPRVLLQYCGWRNTAVTVVHSSHGGFSFLFVFLWFTHPLISSPSLFSPPPPLSSLSLLWRHAPPYISTAAHSLTNKVDDLLRVRYDDVWVMNIWFIHVIIIYLVLLLLK